MRVLVATLAVFVLAAAPAAAGERPCTRAKSKTVFETRSVRVYERRVRHADRIFACLHSVGRAWELGRVWDHGYLGYSRIHQFEARGRLLAYVSAWAYREGPSATVHVRDLRTGRPLHAVGREDLIVSRMVMSHRGAVAWAERTFSEPGVHALRRSDSRAENELLDWGPGVDPASLRVRRGRVQWRNAGELRSAPLR